jgi:hypothetical protein
VQAYVDITQIGGIPVDEIRLACLACGVTPKVPMSDHYELPPFVFTETGEIEVNASPVVDASKLELPDGTVVEMKDLADDATADAVRDYLQGMPCPRCGSDQMRMTL